MTEKIQISCPACNAKLAVSSQLVGQSRKCPKCGVQITIGMPRQSSEPNAPASNPLDAPLDPLAPAPNASFQAKLAKHRSQQPKRALTRKEKLQRAKSGQAHGENEFDWQMASWGLALVIVAFVSVGMPDAESVRGGRGVIKLLGKVLFLLGPFAPLLGMLLGLGGVGLIVIAAKNLPKAANIAIGSTLSLMIVLACGFSFLNTTGAFDSVGKGSSSNASRQLAQLNDPEAAKKRQELIDKAEAMKASSRLTGAGNGTANQRAALQDSQPPKPATRNPFENKSGQDDPAPDENANPFAGGESVGARSEEKPDNPFKDSPESNATKDDSSGQGNPFEATGDSGSFPAATDFQQQVNKSKLRNDVAMRFAKGESLIRFQQRGFSNSSANLKLGNTAGEASRIGRAFYSDEPIDGFTFWQETVTYLVPCGSQESNDMTTHVKPGEAVYGVNVNFENGKLVGVQGIFANEADGPLDDAQLSTGDWLGRKPLGDQFESISGKGKKIHGFAVSQKGFDIIGIQLIVGK